MPPTRRSTTKATANSNQRTLSFTNTTKISKTSHPQNADTKKALAASSSSISLSPPSKVLGHTPTTTTTTSASPKPEAEPQQQQQQQQTPEEILAAKITDAKIGKYWKEREQLRLAPRVHQKELSVAERVLREWDCMTQFGPSIGITRTKRWNRAHRLGLNPPLEVLAVLLKESQNSSRSHIDELMSSRTVIGDGLSV